MIGITVGDYGEGGSVDFGSVAVDPGSRQVALSSKFDITLEVNGGPVVYQNTMEESEVIPISLGTTFIDWRGPSGSLVSLESESSVPIAVSERSRTCIVGADEPYLVGDLPETLGTTGQAIAVMYRTSALNSQTQRLMSVFSSVDGEKGLLIYVSSDGDNVFHSGWETVGGSFGEGLFSGVSPLIVTDTWHLFVIKRVAGSQKIFKYTAGVEDAVRERTTNMETLPDGIDRIYLGRWGQNPIEGGTTGIPSTATIGMALVFSGTLPDDEAFRTFSAATTPSPQSHFGSSLVAAYEMHGDGLWECSKTGSSLKQIVTAAEATAESEVDPGGADEPFEHVTDETVLPTFATDEYLDEIPGNGTAITLTNHNGWLRIAPASRYGTAVGATVTARESTTTLKTFTLNADTSYIRVPWDTDNLVSSVPINVSQVMT